MVKKYSRPATAPVSTGTGADAYGRDELDRHSVPRRPITVVAVDLVSTGGLDRPQWPIWSGNTALCQANDRLWGRALWASDGTPGGTGPLHDLDLQTSSFPNSMAAAGKRLFFLVADEGFGEFDLWVSDGSRAGTRITRNLEPGPGPLWDRNVGGRFDYPPVPRGKKVYFLAETAEEGIELWVTDGWAAGSALVRDIYPGEGSSEPAYLTADGVTGFEPWIWKPGTPAASRGRRLSGRPR